MNTGAAADPPFPSSDFATVDVLSTGTKREDLQVYGLNSELCPEEFSPPLFILKWIQLRIKSQVDRL